MKTFTQYLQTIHMKEHPALLDDDLPDAFDNWLSELDTDELINYADKFVDSIYTLIETFKIKIKVDEKDTITRCSKIIALCDLQLLINKHK